MHFFLKKVFLVVALNTQAANAVSPSNKTNKAVRYGNVFIFCSHYYRSEALPKARQGGGSSSQVMARPVGAGLAG